LLKKKTSRAKQGRPRTSALLVSAVGILFTLPGSIFLPLMQRTPSGLSGFFQLASVAIYWGKEM